MARRKRAAGLSAAEAERLRPHLEAFVEATPWTDRLSADPVEFPHRFSDPRDIEVTALISACLAYGRVDLFKPKLRSLFAQMGPSPARFVRELDVPGAARLFDGFVYRFNLGADLAVLLLGIGKALREHGSLEALFVRCLEDAGNAARGEGEKLTRAASVRSRRQVRGSKTPALPPPSPAHGDVLHAALSAFLRALRDVPMPAIRKALGKERGLQHLLPVPLGPGAAKRLQLFLRWMVRGPDEVDFGIWTRVPKSVLMIPLDTHIARMAKNLGLTRRNDLGWKTAAEITASLRLLDPEDPVRFDFPLCHYGMSGGCPAKPVAAKCARCALLPVCRVGPRVLRSAGRKPRS